MSNQADVQTQLAAALAVPLPSSPPTAHVDAAPSVVAEATAVGNCTAPAAPVRVSASDYSKRAARSYVQCGCVFTQAPVVKTKVLALAMAEQARKKEEQLQQERKQKKELLERQREAARQLAMQGLPKAAALPPGESSLRAPLQAGLPASALAARPALDTATKASAMPRLKQAMEVRNQGWLSHPNSDRSHRVNRPVQRSGTTLKLQPTKLSRRTSANMPLWGMPPTGTRFIPLVTRLKTAHLHPVHLPAHHADLLRLPRRTTPVPSSRRLLLKSRRPRRRPLHLHLKARHPLPPARLAWCPSLPLLKSCPTRFRPTRVGLTAMRKNVHGSRCHPGRGRMPSSTRCRPS